MDYKEALAYLDSIEYFGSKPGLERITAMLEKLGNPQQGMRFVHIAGTNGKGSCAAMTASVLKAAGYKTGLYTSPYLYRFNERMQINGKEIDDQVLADLVTRVKPIAEGMEDHPTVFEIMTATALLWYKEAACDIVVLEVGLGGRFDATNVIAAPECAVIMNIGLDHTAVLGDTIEQIAFEKAGILKPGCDAVLFQQTQSVTEVVRERCDELGISLHVPDFDEIRTEFDSLYGQTFTYKGESYALPLLGEHQLKNAATVLEVVEVLRAKGWKLEQSDVEHGLYAVYWPGRFELLSEEPFFVVDGGHNPQCALTVRDNLLHYFPTERRILLLGILRDKDYAGLTAILNEAADEYICITPRSPRALPAQELADFLNRYNKPVAVCDSIRDGVSLALDRSDEGSVVCAVGSLYSVGEIRACFERY